jgi:hypothetical protein
MGFQQEWTAIRLEQETCLDGYRKGVPKAPGVSVVGMCCAGGGAGAGQTFIGHFSPGPPGRAQG